LIALVAVPGTAAAQRVWEAEGTFNVGYNQTAAETIQADPMAEPGDTVTSVSNRFFSEIRPSIAVQSGTARLLWRLAYVFAGTVALDSTGSTSYNNQAEASLAAQATKFTIVSLNASASQGSTTFLLTSRPADMGTPDLRAPGNPALLGASLAESINSEIGRRTNLNQVLIGTFNSPQDDFSRYSAALAGALGIEHVFPRDNIGLEARSAVSRLQPLTADGSQYTSTTNGIVARWNHDFTYNMNGIATFGVEQVYTDSGSKPLAFSPVGTLTAIYTQDRRAGAIEAAHSSLTNIQVGTVSFSDRITARGFYTLNVEKQRVISASLGFLHNEPIGEAEAVVAAGTGYAAQADAGFLSKINDTLNFTARYSIAYQFGQGGGLGPTLAQIVLVGVTARYSNIEADRINRPRSARGRRVDRSDGLFPVVDEAPVNAP